MKHIKRMKHIKFQALAGALLILTMAFAGCSAPNGSSAGSSIGSSVSSESSSSVSGNTGDPSTITESSESSDDIAQSSGTVTDMTGREVQLPDPVERVVVLSAADCEIIYALGQEDKLVGRGEYCDYPLEAQSVESVQSGDDTNTEQIIALQPDLLVMSTMAQTIEQVEQFEKAGIAVVLSEAATIQEVYEAITLIGDCLDAADEADALVSDMKQSFDAVQGDLPEEGGSIYFEVSPLEYGLWTAGSDTFMDEIANMLHLDNSFSDVSGWAEVSQEQVIDRNPDYMVTISMVLGDGETPDQEILNRSGWEDITAVKNKQVLLMDSDVLSRPGPRLADAAKDLRELIYGS